MTHTDRRVYNKNQNTPSPNLFSFQSSALCISVDSAPSESHFVQCHSLHRLGNINQVRGELSEAVARYSAVLALQPNYLPALKGAQSVGY